MKLGLKRTILFLLVLMVLGVNITIPSEKISAATCKTETYNYYFLTHYETEEDYEQLVSATNSSPMLVNTTGYFDNLWPDDVKIVDEVVTNSFTDDDIKMYWDLIIKGDYIKDADGYHIYHQSGFSFEDGDIISKYSTTQRYVMEEIGNTNSSQYNEFVTAFKKALVNPVANLSSVSVDKSTLTNNEISINVKRALSYDNVPSNFERYHLVFEDNDDYIFYSPMKYSVTVEYDCVEDAPEPEVPEDTSSNPQTFDLPIFIVWGVGGAALIYSVYYFIKYYKSQKENV